MQQQLEKALIERGVVSATLMDDARHACQSGDRSLLLTLLASGVDDEAVCAVVADVCRLPRVSDAHLASVRPSAFQRVPAEVLHDAAMVPLRFGASKELHVAVVDPTQQTKLDEAEFFAGVPLVVHVLTASQMAMAFERLSGRPWSVGEPIALRPTGAKRVRVEPLPEDAEVEVELTLLHRKDVNLSTESGSVVSVSDGFAIGMTGSDSRVTAFSESPGARPGLAAATNTQSAPIEAAYARQGRLEQQDLVPIGFSDEDESPDDASEWRDPLPRRRDFSSAERNDLSDDTTGEHPISGRFKAVDDVVSVTGGVSRLDSSELRAVVSESREESNSALASLSSLASIADDPLAGVDDDDLMVEPRQHPSGSLQREPETEQDGEDTAGPWSNSLTESSRGKILPAVGFGDGGRDAPRPPSERVVVEGVPSRQGRPTPQPPMARERRTEEIPRTQMKAAQRRRMSTTSAVVIPADISAARIPHEGELESVSSLARRLGDADKPTDAAYAAAINGVEVAKDRDGVVTQLVDALGCVYPNVLVLSVLRPELVVWAAQTEVAYPRLVGSKFEVAPDGIWDKVTTELLAYSGPLPAGDPLRRVLRRSAGDNILILPVTLNKRAILLLVMNDSRSQVLRAPGRSATALVRSVGRALKRVILNTKRTT